MKEICNLGSKRKNTNSFLKTVVTNLMRNYNTIEYLGILEQLNNPDFNSIEF